MAQIGADYFLQTSRLERGTVFTWQVKQQFDGFLRKTLSSAASVKSADEFSWRNKGEKNRNKNSMDVHIMCKRLSRSSPRMATRNGIIAVSINNCPAFNRPEPNPPAASDMLFLGQNNSRLTSNDYEKPNSQIHPRLCPAGRGFNRHGQPIEFTNK